MNAKLPVEVISPSGVKGLSLTILQNRSHEDFAVVANIGNMRYYAVMDGHGCRVNVPDVVSKHVGLYLKDFLHHYFSRLLVGVDVNNESVVRQIMTDLFVNLDKELYSRGAIFGCTCSVVLITDQKIYQINIGDSRSILLDQTGNIVSETKCHVTTDPEERKRIESCGGSISDNRVNGTLAMTRAIGDFSLKVNGFIYPQVTKVSAVPDVICVPKSSVSVIMLGTDGVFCDRAIVATLIDILRGSTLKESSEKIANHCRGRNDDDDLAIMVIHV